ncbi:MAG: hypothetical protein E7012_04295 [Alphaproteobacteria bacterium]|nr:hypothetical protein [Alphaproteobacteria bacterium]
MPTGGNCSNITCDGTTKYKLNSCNSGYTQSGDTCNLDCDFSSYPLSSCPSNGTCSNYSCGGTTQYKLESCNSGYQMNSAKTKCSACSFSGYSLTSCPSRGTCSSKSCGGTTKYKLDSCKTGYKVNSAGTKCEACDYGDYTLTSCPTNETCEKKTCGGKTMYRIADCSACIDMSVCSDGGSLNSACDCYEYCCDDFMEWWENGGYEEYCAGNYDEDEFQKCWWDVGVFGRGPEPACFFL